MIQMLTCAVMMTCALTGSGCGYQQSSLTANANGGYRWGTLYRGDIHTVAVPIFANHSYYRGLEFTLTKAIINEVEAESPYKVVSREQADSVLEGEIQRVRVRTLSLGATSITPQEQLLLLTVNFRWKDLRTGKIITSRRDFEQTAPYYPTLGEGQFVAQQESIEKLALAIVQQLQAEW